MRIQLPYRLVILASLSGLAACNASSPQPPGGQRPVSVSAIQAAYAEVPDQIVAPGTVQPRTRTALAAQINGFAREVLVRAGDSVRAGQLLATLDAREADSQKAAAAAAVEEARASLSEAQKSAEMSASMRDAARASAQLAAGTYSRYEKLFAARSVSPQELDEMRARRDASAADLAAREAMVGAAQDRLRQATARIAQATAHAGRADVVYSWTEIKATAAGRIAERLVDPGSAVFPGSPLLVVESAADPQVLAELPTNQIRYLQRGLEVRVRDGAQPANPLKGRISEIIPVSDPASHTVQFKVDLPAGFSAPPGSYMTVSIPMGSRQALLVPQSAVRENGQLTGVFVIDTATVARFRLVKLAAYDPERVEVLSGIEPGERIIAVPGNQIVDGTPVEVRQ